MKTLKIFTILISSLFCISLFAQTVECGTMISDADLNLLRTSTIALRSTSSINDEIRHFPIQHHIVRRTNGYGGLSASALHQIIEELNNAYKGANIQFTLVTI